MGLSKVSSSQYPNPQSPWLDFDSLRIKKKLNMKDVSMLLDRIDGLIMEILKNSKNPLSAYTIAKEVKISWSTANIHCYKLKSLGILEDRIMGTEIGQKKTYWRLKAKTPSLNTYMK